MRMIVFIMIHCFFFCLIDSFADIKAIVFDCDGTLVDSEDAHFTAWKNSIAEYGLDLQLSDWNLFTGKGDVFIGEFYSKKLKQNVKDALIATKRAVYSDLQKMGISPIQLTVDFVHRLALEKEKLGLKLGVASAGRKEEILNSLNHLGIASYFDVILSGHDDLEEYNDNESKNKPKPYIYLHAAKLLNLKPCDCVAIEDSSTGVMAAARAGFVVIAVPNNFTTQHDFSEADYVLDSFNELSPSEFIQECDKLISNRIDVGES